MRVKKAYSVTYELIENNAILIRKIAGAITMREIIELWEEDIQNKRVTKDLKAVVTDLTKAKNLSKIEDRKKISVFYRKNLDFFKNIKIAVVVNDPSIAVSLMYEHENRDLQHLSFSALSAAMKWLKK